MSKANKVFAAISNRSWIADISDERAQGNSIIVTLKDGWFFNADSTCGVRGFDTVRETAMGTSKNSVNNPTLVKPQKVKKPKVSRVAKFTKTAPVVEAPAETKPVKALSMSKDAIRKREARAKAKAAKEIA
jgi:hypothetical protein